jgi:hypothetical protein
VALVGTSSQKKSASSFRSHWIEAGTVLAAIVLVPIAFQTLSQFTYPFAFLLGFNDFAGNLGGSAGTTDVGWEVAASRALLDPGVSAYAPLTTIAALIDMAGDSWQANSHPPTALPLGIPLAFVPYSWWLPCWMIAMICTMAITMRVMGAPIWASYPTALLLGLTSQGQNVLTGTYPVMGVALALAWRYQRRPTVAALSYAVIAASRGIGIVLLLYPLVRRRWRTVITALVTVLVLSLLAVWIEPNVVSGFLDAGRASIMLNLDVPILTPAALLMDAGLPWWLAWLAAPAIAAAALLRRRSLFWVIAWLSFAITPVAWPHSFAMALPLAVMIWRSGGLGVAFMILSAAPLLGNTSHVVIVWPVFLFFSAIALFACRLEDEPTTVPKHLASPNIHAD